MALRILRGTNSQRQLYVPQQGELIFVTDFQTANVDPLYVGDGQTAGGIPVGQNAVLSGTVEGDIQLNGFTIEGTGLIDITGNITASGTISGGSLNVTNGNITVTSGNVNLQSGDVNVIGDIEASGTITANSFTGDLVGSVTSSDNVLLMIDSDQKLFVSRKITLDDGPGPKIEISNLSIKRISDDPEETQIFLGSEENPTSLTHYRTYPERAFGRVTTDSEGNTIWPNITLAVTYRGTLDNPQPTQTGDLLQGTIVQSYTSAGSLSFSGGSGWVAENQAGASDGFVPSTFVLGSGSTFAQLVGALATQQFDTVLNESLALKYTSQGQLKIGTLVLSKTTNAGRSELPNVDGTMLYNFSSNEIQVLISGVWKKFVLADATPS